MSNRYRAYAGRPTEGAGPPAFTGSPDEAAAEMVNALRSLVDLGQAILDTLLSRVPKGETYYLPLILTTQWTVQVIDQPLFDILFSNDGPDTVLVRVGQGGEMPVPVNEDLGFQFGAPVVRSIQARAQNTTATVRFYGAY